MESMIDEYPSYQAALCAHNLEGHMIALWANEAYGTTKYSQCPFCYQYVALW